MTVEKLYSKEEGAKILSISPIALGDWLRKGKIRGVKLGRVWRIPESALEELARDGTRKE